MFKKSFKARLMSLVLIPIIVLSTVLTVLSAIRLITTLEGETEMKLKSAAYAVRDLIKASGDVTFVNDKLLIGGNDGEYLNSTFDSITADSGMFITLFYGDTRRATSVKNGNERATGTQAAQEVSAKVLKGEEYVSLSTQVVGTECVVAYIPLRDSKNNVVGMVFTGIPKTQMNTDIKSGVGILIGVAVALTLLVIVIAYIVINKIISIILAVENECSTLAKGDFSGSCNITGATRADQLGDLARSMQTLKSKLAETIGAIKQQTNVLADNAEGLADSSNRSSTNISELSNAVEDIANGATTQAEDVQDSTNNVSAILGRIDEMNSSVNSSMALSEEMLDDSKNVVKSFDVLLKDISTSIDKLHAISAKMKMVSDAVSDVTKASDEIDAIAAQTNLLSLNASIEAARAGEAGRGFAVVAGEISSLAAQSKDSATRIKEIMNNLSEETTDAVTMVTAMSKIMDAQSDSSKESQQSIEGLIAKIDSSKELTATVADGANEVQALCVQLNDAMSSLSAISEENTASTEETSASLQQMSLVVQEVADMAAKLTTISDDIKGATDFFLV